MDMSEHPDLKLSKEEVSHVEVSVVESLRSFSVRAAPSSKDHCSVR